MTVDNPPTPGATAPIRVLFVSTSYPRDATDWRGIFMAHINAALARRDGVSLMQWSPPGKIDAGIEYVATASEAAWLAKLMERGGISHWLRARPVSGIAAAGKLLRLLRAVYRRIDKVDLYHINWLQCALPLPGNRKPALMTVLGNDMRLLRLPGMRTLLRRAMRGRNIAICPNASWMEAPLRQTFGDLAAIVSVPFGIDPRWYAIRRSADALCMPPRWLVVTRLTANKLGPLFEWSEPLFADGRRELHLFGPMQEQIAVPSWVNYHGSATPEQLSGEWFPHAHGLITLSRHSEGRPQVMLEAMAASLPIVASRMPAHADIVMDDATGALCDTPADYANALAMLEQADNNMQFGNAARAWVAREIGTWDDCAGRYAAIYRHLLEQPAHG